MPNGRRLPDGVASPQPDPLGNGAVLLLRFRKLLLGAERLVRLTPTSATTIVRATRLKSAYRHVCGARCCLVPMQCRR
jgi:hypothetical protein